MEASLETMDSVNSNILVRFTGVLKCPLGPLAEDMPVADTKNLGAGVAVLIMYFMEIKPKATMDIIRLPLHSSNWHSQSSGEMMTDIDGRVVVRDNA